MYRVLVLLFLSLFFLAPNAFSQDRVIMIPQQVEGAPFHFNDTEDHFGQAYRWFHEGQATLAYHELRKVIAATGYNLDPKAYYVVVANFTDEFSPIGMFHGEDSLFFDTRLYGVNEDNLYYIFISREHNAESFVSVLSSRKNSPTEEGLLPFLSLFLPIIPPGQSVQSLPAGTDTWVDIRRFSVPEKHRRFADFSFIVKRKLSDTQVLAQGIFDNTARESWSYGIATALTSINDVDIVVGADGTITIEPKSELDLATFAVVNYHFSPIDTKDKSFGNSWYALAGIRLIDFIEPIGGVGASFDLGIVDLGIFAGYSLEFAQELRTDVGVGIGDNIADATDEDIFDLKLRGKPRFGIQIKFP